MSLASPREIVTALRDYGLRVFEVAGWETRGTGYSFDPFGQAWHHDAISEAWSDDAAIRLLRDGRTDLRGPLCNGLIDSDSRVGLVAYGNANHAGRNERDVLDRMRAGQAPLGDARLDPDGDSVVGNPLLWGWECRNTGVHGDVWEQLDAMERAGAALCEVNGWSPNANAAHRELTARKPDPVDIHMPTFRADIARILKTHSTEALFMYLTEAEEREILAAARREKPSVVRRQGSTGINTVAVSFGDAFLLPLKTQAAVDLWEFLCGQASPKPLAAALYDTLDKLEV